MIAEILCVGTELLMGQVLNTNAQFLSRRLSALGITQQHQTVVGDNAQRLEDAYRLALSRADIVITSGGLGPTVDDITKRVAAKVAGKELVLFPEAEEMVRTRFQQYHRNMTLNNLSQAMFTADSTLLMNPNGTAPGAIVPMGDGKVVIHLPGPPCELEPMFTASVEPYLMARSGRALVSRYVRIFGMGESEVDTRLRDLENGENPTLSPYCALGEVQLRATASADTAEEALAETKSISRQEADDAVTSRQVAAANLDVARKQLELLLAGSREEDVAQALAQYNQAKASLTIREQNLKDAVLYAPGNGVVRNRILEKGDMASPQKPVYNISLNHTKWVRAYLTESQLGKVKPGFSATVRNDSFPDTGFKGTVGFISSVAEFTPKNVETPDLRTALVYEVRIIVDDPDNRLRLGAPATVTIPLDQNAGTQTPEQPRP